MIPLPPFPDPKSGQLFGNGKVFMVVDEPKRFSESDMEAFALAERAAERARCAAICEGLADRNEQATADQRSREAPDEKEQLARLRHWSTVSTYNAGMKNCAAAIRNQP